MSSALAFRDSQTAFLGWFVQNIGHGIAVIAELSASMFAIGKSREQNWKNIG